MIKSIAGVWILTITVLTVATGGSAMGVTTTTIPQPFETEAACKVAASKYRNSMSVSTKPSRTRIDVTTTCMNLDDPTTTN